MRLMEQIWASINRMRDLMKEEEEEESLLDLFYGMLTVIYRWPIEFEKWMDYFLKHNWNLKKINLNPKTSKKELEVNISSSVNFIDKNMEFWKNLVYQNKKIMQKAGCGLSRQIIYV